MNKLLLTLLSITLVVLLTITSILFYAFSPSGNDALKSYLQEELESTIGLPVEIRKFSLEAGKSSITLRVNKQATIEVLTHFNLLKQTFKGIYHVKANHFEYDELLLRQVDIQGHFNGVAEDILVDGKGTALDANVVYHLRVLENVPQEIVGSMRGVSLSEVLALLRQPPLVEGKIDIELNMPDIGQEFAKGYGQIILHKAYFNVNSVKKMYDLTLPEKSYVVAKIDVKLKGNNLNLLATSNSNLFDLKLDNTTFNLKSKKVSASYVMDVKQMGILTQNKLMGALKVIGTAELEEGKYQLNGSTNSLGGTLLFDIAEVSKFHFENVELAKILHLTKQPAYAKGRLSGSGDIDKKMNHGRYDLQVEKGQFGAKSIENSFGYQIPSVNSFTFKSKGTIAQKVLKSEVLLKSTVSDIKLTGLVYDIEKNKLESVYDVFFPNVGLFIPDNKAVKRGYISVKGDMSFYKTLKVKGSAKGLGEKLNFSYDSKSAKVDAQNLFVEKLLSLSALPRYVKGKLSTTVNITNIDTLEGTFSLESKKLVTQANAMEKLIGKKLAIDIALKSKGKMKKGVAYVNTKINTSMGTLHLDNTVYNTNNATFTSAYVLDIPALEKTYALTKKKLYGAMVLSGDIAQDKTLKVTGITHSLGGKVEYTFIDDTLNAKIEKVSVENILGMLGHDTLVQGDAYGTVRYARKSKTGVIDMDIKSFKIKPSSTTNTVKMFIGKDPTRIIYSSSKLHAKVNGDITRYTLHAKGAHSTIDVTEGIIDKKGDTHTARFKFVYDKYEVTGSIVGSADNPKMMIDPASIMQSKTGEKIQKKLDKALGGEMGKAVGSFLKGFKF